MPYFHISVGLRGCYMPDGAFVVKVKSRKELRAIVSDECYHAREAYGYGGSQKEISWMCAKMWKETKAKRPSYLPYAIGFGRTRDANDRPFGVFVRHATRTEYVEYCNENE